MLLGGVNDQLRFGPSGTCLLFVENYHQSPTPGNDAWLFDSYSGVCGVSIFGGSLALIMTIVTAALHIYLVKSSTFPSKNVWATLIGIDGAMSLFFLVLAYLMNSGLSTTCREFEKAGSCSSIFSRGFIVDGAGHFSKNLTTASAAVFACWLTAFGFVFFTIYHAKQYRSTALVWWSSL